MLAPYWSALRNNEFGIADKLNSAPKYVVSSTMKKADWNNSTIIRDAKRVVAEITRLKQQPGQKILIPGSATLVQSLMEAELIDEYRFLVHPIIMGRGKRFFKDGLPTTRLKLVKTKTLGLGVMLLCYQPAESPNEHDEDKPTERPEASEGS
jgi:dihydrofolate reductase